MTLYPLDLRTVGIALYNVTHLKFYDDSRAGDGQTFSQTSLTPSTTPATQDKQQRYHVGR